MRIERELLKEFIDFVDSYEFYPTERNIIWEIVSRTQELLAQPEPTAEPVAWIIETEIYGKLSEWVCTDKKRYMEAHDGTKDPIPLYTAPQKQPLSDDEMRAIWKEGIRCEIPFVEIGRAIEKAHGIGVDDEN